MKGRCSLKSVIITSAMPCTKVFQRGSEETDGPPASAVYQDGTLCLDIIQNKWSPSYTVSSVLTSIQSLLTDPNCGSPANPEAAELYLQDKKAYTRRVRRLTEESLGGV